MKPARLRAKGCCSQMSSIILLDAGPLGIISNPRFSSQNLACHQWVKERLAGGAREGATASMIRTAGTTLAVGKCQLGHGSSCDDNQHKQQEGWKCDYRCDLHFDDEHPARNRHATETVYSKGTSRSVFLVQSRSDRWQSCFDSFSFTKQDWQSN